MLFVAVKISRKSENLAEISFGKSWLLAWLELYHKKTASEGGERTLPPTSLSTVDNFEDHSL